jgi:hypothetical protein
VSIGMGAVVVSVYVNVKRIVARLEAVVDLCRAATVVLEGIVRRQMGADGIIPSAPRGIENLAVGGEVLLFL